MTGDRPQHSFVLTRPHQRNPLNAITVVDVTPPPPFVA